MTIAIEVTGLSKTFGRNSRALHDVSLAIEKGEMIALIGASGSGKSTLLRHISGLIVADPSSTSEIKVFGQPVQAHGKLSSGIRKRRARIGFVFQQFNLVNRLSVIKNVLCGRLATIPWWRSLPHRFSEAERVQAIRALDRVGIAEQAFKRASLLSGGQQQRAAIARSIVQEAEIILADEPIASLDPESSRIIMDILAGLNRTDGTTVVVSLHQVDFAIRYCPRTVALRDGRIIFDGPSKSLNKQMLLELYGSSAKELFGASSLEDEDLGAPESAPPETKMHLVGAGYGEAATGG